MYTFRGFYISEHMMDGLERWIKFGIKPGNFLTAVLENDLKNAVGYADAENLQNLPAYVGYLYNEAPGDCWGSKEKVAVYAERKLISRRLAGDES